MLLHCPWFFSSCCRFLLLIPMTNPAAFGWPAVELAGRMPVFEHESMPTASAKEKPFQPNWSASMDHRRKAGGGEKAAANLEPQMMGGSSSSWSHSTDEEEYAHGQQQKKPPAPVGGDWADPAQGEHKIVHLTSRPTQLYYHNQQEGPELGSSDTVELGTGQVCRVKVPATEVFYIAYEDGVHSRPTVDLFFHCSQYWAWCCGVDCCQVDPSVLLTGLCICILAIAFLVHFCLRSRFGQRFCLDRLFKRRKRVIARANAQRRKRSGDSSQGGEMRRIRTNSLKDNKRGAHKKLVRAAGGSASFKEAKVTTATTKTGGAASSKGVPEIVITEPSSCYEPSSKSDYEEDEDYEY